MISTHAGENKRKHWQRGSYENEAGILHVHGVAKIQVEIFLKNFLSHQSGERQSNFPYLLRFACDELLCTMPPCFGQRLILST
jgi:hypothetical protein